MTRRSATGKTSGEDVGKPRRRRKEARPAEIIDAGLKEFAERGFAGTRLDDVAARAGIAKGTIYRYFASKEALFEAALLSRVTPMLDGIEAMVDGYPGSSVDLLRFLITKVHGELVTSDVQVLMRIIIGEGHRFPGVAEAYYRGSIAKGRELLERIVARGIARGEFRAGAAAELPIVIAAPAVMAAIWRMTFDPVAPIPPERFLAAHLDLALHGMEQRKA
jgi:AcrR family transcriptional regulator